YGASFNCADSSLTLRSPIDDFFSTTGGSSVCSSFLLSAACLPPLSTVFLPFSHSLADNVSSFLVCPIASRLHEFQICIPYCIVNSEKLQLYVPVTNTCNTPISLPAHC